MPLFSIVIPTYNRAGMIGQTLDSVLNQQGIDRGELEIIVVDDGSTDHSSEVLETYAKNHGVRVVRQMNRGEGAARNTGIENATGQYIANLDSDDLWFPWTAATYRDLIEKHGCPALLTGRQHEFRDISEVRTVTREETKVESFPDYYSGYDRWRFFGTSSFVIRREIVVAVGGFPGGWGVAEDADMGMRLGIARGFVEVRSPATFAYRIHGGNIMNNIGRVYVGACLLIDHEIGGHYPGGLDRRRARLEVLTRPVRACVFNCLKRNQFKMAWDLYFRTFAWHLGLGRVRFVFAFPFKALMAFVFRASPK